LDIFLTGLIVSELPVTRWTFLNLPALILWQSTI